MSKTYKLQKWYPSLPKDWEVGMEVGQGDRNAIMANFSPCSSKYSDVQLPYKEIVNNPEFWLEIKEEYPKIVSFRCKRDEDLFILQKTLYHSKNWSCSLESLLYIGECVKSGHYEIYQVATSPVETFTLGDKVEYHGEICNIIDIYFNEHKQLSFKVNAKTLTIPKTGVFELDFRLNFLKKVKSLFVTEDEIEIFIGDSCHLVNTSCWQLYENSIQDRNLILPSWMKAFKDLEKAKKYLEENKPRFSKKDVEKALNVSIIQYGGFPSLLSHRLFNESLGI